MTMKLKVLLIFVLSILIVIPVYLNMSFDSEDILAYEEVMLSKGTDYNSAFEIVLVDETKRLLLNKFLIPFSEYKDVYDAYYYIKPISDDIFAYDMSFSYVDGELLKGKYFNDLSVKESRKWLKKIGVDLDFMDELVNNFGYSKYNIYISEVIPGYTEDESTIIVKHELDRLDYFEEGSNYTVYMMTRYKLRNIDGKLKIFTRTKSYGFGYHEDDSLNRGTFEEQMFDLESRYFIDGESNYMMKIDMNHFMGKYY